MMKKKNIVALALMLAMFPLFLGGCITVASYEYEFNYETGILKVVYHDLRSKKGLSEDDYSPENDWTTLEETLSELDEEYDKDVIEILAKEISPENEVLSGSVKYRVNCPKCFPSKIDIFKKFHEDLTWQNINGEIFLILPNDQAILATNGKTINTEKNNIIVWDENEVLFKYHLKERHSGGETLLPYYLKAQESKKGNE